MNQINHSGSSAGGSESDRSEGGNNVHQMLSELNKHTGWHVTLSKDQERDKKISRFLNAAFIQKFGRNIEKWKKYIKKKIFSPSEIKHVKAFLLSAIAFDEINAMLPQIDQEIQHEGVKRIEENEQERINPVVEIGDKKETPVFEEERGFVEDICAELGTGEVRLSRLEYLADKYGVEYERAKELAGVRLLGIAPDTGNRGIAGKSALGASSDGNTGLTDLLKRRYVEINELYDGHGYAWIRGIKARRGIDANSKGAILTGSTGEQSDGESKEGITIDCPSAFVRDVIVGNIGCLNCGSVIHWRTWLEDKFGMVSWKIGEDKNE